MHKFLLTLAAVFLTGLLIPAQTLAAPRLQDVGEKLVIVIDPGHGGENQGTIENNHEEKQMTLTTALAMYDELLKYDGIEVYLTRTEDVDMDLEERAEFAAEVEADFLFSIHYNASLNHELYGSEVWVSLFPPYNGYGYQFGYEFLTAMREKGLLVRGVKTRRGNDGDYYGIVRQSVEREIPAVIIEHCHVDEARDAVYCDSDEKLREFGREDATAVARYFGLKSSALNVDYSDYPLTESSAESVVRSTMLDDTEPDICQIEFSSADLENSTLSLVVLAADYDSALLYYSYSTDGGNTFSAREAWPESDTLTGTYKDTFILTLPVQPGTAPDVIVRAYNLYDLYKESNCYSSPQIFPSDSREPPGEASGDGLQGEEAAGGQPLDGSEDQIDVVPVGADALESRTNSGPKEEISFVSFVILCLLFALVMLAIVVISQCIAYSKRKKRRLQRRNEAGRNKNQHR